MAPVISSRAVIDILDMLPAIADTRAISAFPDWRVLKR